MNMFGLKNILKDEKDYAKLMFTKMEHSNKKKAAFMEQYMKASSSDSVSESEESEEEIVEESVKASDDTD